MWSWIFFPPPLVSERVSLCNPGCSGTHSVAQLQKKKKIVCFDVLPAYTLSSGHIFLVLLDVFPGFLLKNMTDISFVSCYEIHQNCRQYWRKLSSKQYWMLLQRAQDQFPACIWWPVNSSSRASWCPFMASTGTRHVHGTETYRQAKHQNTFFFFW